MIRLRVADITKLLGVSPKGYDEVRGWEPRGTPRNALNGGKPDAGDARTSGRK
jgi:hypothetical protein